MNNPHQIYELLLDLSNNNHSKIERVVIGQVWTVCQTNNYSGLAMSPPLATRTLPWAGTLQDKRLTEITPWVTDWDFFKATVGLSAINCSLNNQPSPPGKYLEPEPGAANLAVFEYFFPQIKDKKIVVIGHYPGIERYYSEYNIKVIERQPIGLDYPDSAAEFLIPEADWVFITGASIANKTFPRLMELASHAKTVLMGPSTPWTTELSIFGVNYLAGIDVMDPTFLFQTAAEGGGVRIFDQSVQYKIVDLTDF
ncbi:MAG: DUF364 domain-containing protein [Methylococcales bacterium]|nr:DUF364 domain-containing protein [Methylococcales bacterium]